MVNLFGLGRKHKGNKEKKKEKVRIFKLFGYVKSKKMKRNMYIK